MSANPNNTERKMKTRNLLASLLALGALLVPAAADAHISLHPNTIPAGAFATLDVRVPGEQEGAHVTKVDVQFPPGFVGVDYENVPGWSTKIVEVKLATPIVEDGETIDTEVSRIIWSWVGPLGKVDDGQFVNFPLSLAIPTNATAKALEFRTVQTYSNGQIVHWIDPSLTAEHPSPRINVTAEGGVIQDIAGDEAGPQPNQTTATTASTTTTDNKNESKGLTIAALIVATIGLAVALAALARSRRNSATV
jgi:uncharacterized protein YcnI